MNLRRWTWALAVGLALPQPAAADEPLEAMIAFADPALCVPAPEFAAVLATLTAPADADARTVPLRIVTDTPPRHTVTGTQHLVELDLSGRWHGLRLTGISQGWTEESDQSRLTLHFANRPKRVIAALNRLGFALPRTGQRVVEEELTTMLAVEPDGDGAQFSCST